MTDSGQRRAREARGFDRLAPVYDLLADLAFAGRIHRSQVAFLPELTDPERALVVGGGTGRFLEALLARSSRTVAASIDISPEMTRRTAARLASAGLAERAELRQGSLELLRPEERFDLIVTHCFLDLFDEAELGDVVAALSRRLLAGGSWLFTDFDASGPGLPGLARRSVVSGLYGFFRLTCGLTVSRLPDFDRAFRSCGLETVQTQKFAAGLLRASILHRAAVEATPG